MLCAKVRCQERELVKNSEQALLMSASWAQSAQERRTRATLARAKSNTTPLVQAAPGPSRDRDDLWVRRVAAGAALCTSSSQELPLTFVLPRVCKPGEPVRGHRNKKDITSDSLCSLSECLSERVTSSLHMQFAIRLSDTSGALA